MSREKQIEEMKKELGEVWIVDWDGNPHELSEKLWDDELENIAIELYNAGYRKQEWISVEDRLPEKWQRVLVNYNGNVCISWQNANGTWFECWNDKVTHWMPLPEAPKMKGGAE